MSRSRVAALAAVTALVMVLSSCLPDRTVGAARGPTRLHRVPSEYPTIQAALDASSPGNTVLVAAGTYTGAGNVDLSFRGKDLVLESEQGAPRTVIDCGSQRDIGGITFINGESRAAVLDGFTIRHGWNDGGAIGCFSASPTIRSCRLVDNKAPDYGGAVACGGTASPLIEDCDLIGNIVPAVAGPAIDISSNASLTMERCRIAGNEGGGGAIDASRDDAGSIVLEDCVISGNACVGVQIGGGVSVDLENCLVAHNDEGGLLLTGGPALVAGCTITRNSSTSMGAGIAASGAVRLERTILSDNCAPQDADLITNGRVTFTCCQFNVGGISVAQGGQIDSVGPQVHGDPLFCAPRTCPAAKWETPDSTSPGDYTLRSDSPCLPQFSPCGQQIGAFGMGCSAPEPVGACCLADHSCLVVTREQCQGLQGIYEGDNSGCYPNPCLGTAIEETTWGRIKSRFKP